MTHARKFPALLLLPVLLFLADFTRASPTIVEFSSKVLSDSFHGEGASVADLDSDGHLDVISGPFWYAGPDFSRRHRYTSGEAFPVVGYSDHFFSFTDDFNGDGRPDILVIPIPGLLSHWFENPGDPSVTSWKKHPALDGVDGESPEYMDLTGDGKPELVCAHGGAFGYAEPTREAPGTPWKFVPVTPKRGYHRFTHGLGIGDVNGDGRQDLLETNGWWEQTATPGELFRFHPVRFARSGGAQMFTSDLDGDGDADVISTRDAHAYGLSWFENTGTEDGEIHFREHPILTENPADNPHGLVISQMHAVALVDLDGDGIEDIVTGKRYWAHNGRDPGAPQLPVLYWFQTRRTENGVEFIPWLIDERAGVGTQLTVHDLDGEGTPDIIIGNKLGTSIHLASRQEVTAEEFRERLPDHRKTRRHPHGTDIFSTHVRTTGPLTPAQEQSTFVLPRGFEIDLVAAEPDIAKPLNLAFDARGRLWVTSTVEYPYPVTDENAIPRDSIRVLEDFDETGRARKVTVFADRLNIPMGLLPWKDGVIAFSIPHIWYLRDTDGDGKADSRERLYGPIGWERDTHGMLNGFTRGLDGWIYACHGFNNHTRVAGTDGHEISMQSGNTFRFRPDGLRVEQVTHGQVNPFGMAFDHLGDLFTADCHTKPVSLLLEGGHHESFGKPHDGLGFIPSVMDHLHGSTAIAGIALGESTGFPAPYDRCCFGGNVMTGRVNLNSLIRRGGSVRAREEPDFLVSGDPWFRPVDIVVGPEGALYVADFYNRIIGHYEVPLDHPGRDRERGRIWRVRFRPGPERPTLAAADEPASRLETDLTRLDPLSQLDQLGSRFLDRTAHLVELLSEPTSPVSREALEARLTPVALSPELARLQGNVLWVLLRRGLLEDRHLERTLGSESEHLRVTTLRVLARAGETLDRSGDLVRRGLKDSSALVRRVAAQAAAARPATGHLASLLETFHSSETSDVHLRHALKIALRNHLELAGSHDHLETLPPSKRDLALAVRISLAVKTPRSARFLVEHLDALPGDDEKRVQETLRFAVRHVEPDSVDRVVEKARRRYPDRPGFQASLLEAIHSGLERRGVSTPASVRDWGLALAREFLDVDDGATEPISWATRSLSGEGAAPGTFVLTTRRRSTDGQENTPLYSSIVGGEQRTGIFRSGVFAVPESLRFYLGGHDGPPDRPAQKKNFVRLRDATTHALLREVSPPRNDTAHEIAWDTANLAGRRVYLELVDGDDGTAYAWLAAGRFSVPGLNPGALPARRRQAASLIARFDLVELDPELARALGQSRGDLETAAVLAGALVRGSSDPVLRALAETPGIEGLPSELVEGALEALASGDGERARELVPALFQVASRPGQQRLARSLSSSRDGSRILLELVEKGQASSHLLRIPEVGRGLAGLETAEERQRVETLLAALPDENEAIVELLAKRRQAYLATGGSAARGLELFRQHCMSCHQVAEEGQKIAPNLDGIGHRGLDRVLEDVLAPGRNVDIAFRTTTVITTGGQVLTGLVRRQEGALLVLADGEGKEFTVPEKDILKRTLNADSLMPSDFGEKLEPAAFNDLMTFLLSLKGS